MSLDSFQYGIRGRLAGLSRYSPAEEQTVHEFSNYVLDHVLGPEEPTPDGRAPDAYC